jgi:ABC-2 type transport system permease protein
MYLVLLKTFLKETFSIQRLFGTKVRQSKIKTALMIGLIVYAFTATGFSMGLIHYELAIELERVGAIHLLWSNVISYMTGIGFLLAFFQANGYLFQYKDFDILGPLPISQRTITLAKVSIMFLFIYLFSSVFVIPIVIVFAIYATLPLYIWIVAIITLLFLPIPMVVLASLTSLMIRRVTQSWIKPQIMQTIFTVLFMLLFVSFNYLQSYLSETGYLSEAFVEVLSTYYAPSRWFFGLIIEGDIIQSLYIMVSHVLIFGSFVWVMSSLTLFTNQQRNRLHITNKVVIPKTIKPILLSFLRKEFGRFVGTSIYFLNTGFGLLMLIIAMIASLIFKPDIDGFLIEISTLGIEPFWLIFLFAGFSISTVYTPAVSLSLEGKNFALLKTLPIPTHKILLSKVVFNLLILLPVVFMTSLGFGFSFSFSVLQTLLLLTLLSTLGVFVSTFFMWVNLWFPRFDFQTEVEVVKQSIGAAIAVFGALFLIGGSAYLVFSPLSGLSIEQNSLILITIYVIGSLVSSVSLFTMGVNVYDKLEI